MKYIVALLIFWFSSSYFLMYAWNEIAAGFNLPQFGYWVSFSIVTLYVLSSIYNSGNKR